MVFLNIQLWLMAWMIFLGFSGLLSPAWAGEPVKISLDQALKMALEHNPALKAARTVILQNQSQEITANLRPNPVLSGDALYFPYTQMSQYTTGNYLDQNAQFDLGVGYTWERGGKRQRRYQAARDVTAVTTSQIADNERQLKFNVASQFINILLAQANLDFSLLVQESFQRTVEISEARLKAGDMSEGDYLKIKVQLLQFQNMVNSARLAKAQALVVLREQLGYASVPADYEVAGQLDYRPLQINREEILALALSARPDRLAALQGITAATSQHDLAKANSYKDLTTSLNFTHVGGSHTAGVLFSIPLGLFDQNQGEIARTNHVLSQARALAASVEETVIGDVISAYEGVLANDRMVALYRSGYLDEARKSRDISQYAYRQGAASLLDYLDAERNYTAMELAYRQALASYLLAFEQLKQAAGIRDLP